ncbi:hypothetical protein AOLI_G00095950 [Acnodon oligacanthus]
MHGLPCSSLQQCFGAPADVADVSPEPALQLDSLEPCRTQPDPTVHPTVLTQPAVASLTEPHHQPAFSCVSIHTKANGSQLKESVPNDKHVLRSSPSSEGFSEDDNALEESPVLDKKYPHIPRPSIIRHGKEQECPLQEVQSDCTDYTETEDGPLSGTDKQPPPPLALR